MIDDTMQAASTTTTGTAEFSKENEASNIHGFHCPHCNPAPNSSQTISVTFIRARLSDSIHTELTIPRQPSFHDHFDQRSVPLLARSSNSPLASAMILMHISLLFASL